ncbi:hypothetical protein [Streptococcus macacae]|uniref:hypothetical protein n=1 Tax=Streptococcus macacae TaxID=1339 RepID=UPI000225C392|nr:hypothetical protein [Streptococcus macacae]SUN78559.1 Uncharacterised protein [Streptococcus macacae NCTC 11558]
MIIDGVVLAAAGLTLLLSNNDNNGQRFDYKNDEAFDTIDCSADSIENFSSRNYPDDRKSPIVHITRREDTRYIRGGTDEDKMRFREENDLDF